MTVTIRLLCRENLLPKSSQNVKAGTFRLEKECINWSRMCMKAVSRLSGGGKMSLRLSDGRVGVCRAYIYTGGLAPTFLFVGG